MRAKFCTHTVMALVSLMVLGITEVTLAQTTTTTSTTTKKSSKKSSKKEEKKAEAATAPVATTPATATTPEEKKEEKKEEVKADNPHKFSGYIGFDYLFEPLVEDTKATSDLQDATGNSNAVSVLEKDYKKQRAIVYPGFSYTYNKKWTAGFFPEFRYNNGHQTGGYPTNPGRLEYARSIIYLGRKALLNEQDHGVNLEVGYVRRLFNKGVFPTNNGNHRLRAVVGKKINDKVNVSVFNEVLYNATKKWTNSAWKFNYNLKPTVNISFTEKLSLTIMYDTITAWYHRSLPNKNKKDFVSENYHILTYTLNDTYSVGNTFKYNYSYNRDGNPDQSFLLAPFTTINLTPTTSLSFEVAWTYSQSNDSGNGLAPRENFHQYPDLAIYFFQSF